MEFRPNFLDNEHPEFFAMRSRKDRLQISAGKVVVNECHLFLAVFVCKDSKHTLSVVFMADKHVHYTLWKLSDRRKCRKEITISNSALKDVTWLNNIFEDL